MRTPLKRVRGALHLTASTGISQIVALAAAPVITRIYSPADFGEFAVFSALLTILAVVSCLRFEFAVMLPDTQETANAVLALALLSTVVISGVVALVVLLGGSKIAEVLGISQANELLLVLPVSLALAGLLRGSNHWLLRERDYRGIAVAKLSQSLPQTALQVLFGLVPLGSLGLVLGDLGGKAAGNAASWRRALKSGSIQVFSLSSGALRTAAHTYRRFPKVVVWSSLINEIGSMAPALLLAGFFGPATAGMYALVQRVYAVPMDLIGQSVAAVFLGEAATIRREDPRRLRLLYLRYAASLLLIGSLPAVLLYFLGRQIFSWVFGSAWEVAGYYAEILSIGFLFRFSISPLAPILNLLERHDLQLLWDIVRTLILVAALAVPFFMRMPAASALISFTCALAFLQFVHFLLSLSQLTKLLP